MKKRAQIGLAQSPGIIMALTLLILIGGSLTIAIAGFRDTQTSQVAEAASTTFTAANSTAVVFDSGAEIVSCTSATYYNGTNAVDITTYVTTTYTVASSCSATLTNNTYNGETVEVNYTLTKTTYDSGYNVSESGLTGFDNFSTQLPTLGTMIAVVIILGVVFGAFAINNMRGGL